VSKIELTKFIRPGCLVPTLAGQRHLYGTIVHKSVMLRQAVDECTVPSSYNCTHACDFLHGTTHFYSVSEVQIHAWFSPTATHGSQRGYKYYHACVAKAVFHA